MAGLEFLLLAPSWLRLLAVGVIGGMVIAVSLKTVKAFWSNRLKEGIIKGKQSKPERESFVSIQLVESRDQYQGLRVLFEEILSQTSSDVSNDAEDIAAMSQANTKIIELIKETLQINPEEDFTARVKKKVLLFSAIRDYLEYYWDSIPEEAYFGLVQTGIILHTSVRDIDYVNKLDKKVYRFYQGIVFSYLHKLSEKLKTNDPNEYLWESRDKEGNIIHRFPTSAEEKAIERISDLDDEAEWEDKDKWVSLSRRDEEITDEEIEKYMKERGLS